MNKGGQLLHKIYMCTIYMCTLVEELVEGWQYGTDLPTSKAGEAMGESSTLKKSCPSVGLCGCGCITSHDTQPSTLG